MSLRICLTRGDYSLRVESENALGRSFWRQPGLGDRCSESPISMTSQALTRAYLHVDSRTAAQIENPELPPSERWAYLAPAGLPLDPDTILRIPGLTDEQRDLFRQHWKYGLAAVPVERPNGSHTSWRLSPKNDWQFPRVQLAGPKFAPFLVMEIDVPESVRERVPEFGAIPNFLGIRYIEESYIVVDEKEQDDGSVIKVPRLEDGMPVVHTSERGRAQLIWLLDNPVAFFEDEAGTIPTRQYRFLQRVRRTLAETLDGDPQFTHGKSRNPLFDGPPYAWRFIHGRTWSLTEIAEACAELGWKVPKPGETIWTPTSFHGSSDVLPTRYQEEDGSEPESRNTWAYYRLTELTIARQGTGQKITKAWLDVTLRQINSDTIGPQSSKGPMPETDIRSISASVMRRHERAMRANRAGITGGCIYTPAQRKRGGLKRAAQESFEDAQARGAETGLPKATSNSIKVRRENRMSNIERAASMAREAMTRRQIAEHLGVKPETVKGYLQDARTQGLLPRN